MRLIAATLAFGLMGLTGFQAFGPKKEAPTTGQAVAAPTLGPSAAGRALLRSCLLAERAAAWACEAHGMSQKRPLERAAGAADAAADYLTSQAPLPADQTSRIAGQLSELAVQLRAAEAKPGNFKKLQPQLEELNKIASLLAEAEAKLWDEHQVELARAPAAVEAMPAQQANAPKHLPLATFALSCLVFAFALVAPKQTGATEDLRARRNYQIAVIESGNSRTVISYAKR